MKSEHLHILQHSLGVDQYGRGTQYRNRFITGEGSKDSPACDELVALGLMIKSAPSSLTGGGYCYRVTPEGIRQMKENSPEPPKLTRSQSRYREWLKADCGEGFREWLKRLKYRSKAS